MRKQILGLAKVTRRCKGDCLEVMPQMPDGCVDLVITDPPYGVNKAEWDTGFPRDWFYLSMKFSRMIIIITGSCGLKDSISLVGDEFIDVIAARNLSRCLCTSVGFSKGFAHRHKSAQANCTSMEESANFMP